MTFGLSPGESCPGQAAGSIHGVSVETDASASPGESRGVDDRVSGKVHVSLRNCKLFFKQLEPPTLTVDSDPPLPVAGQYPWLKVRRCGGEWQFRFQCAGL